MVIWSAAPVGARYRRRSSGEPDDRRRSSSNVPPPSPHSIWIAAAPARSEKSGAPRPFIFRAQHRDRHLGRIRICGNAVLEQVFGGFLDLDVPGERRDDGLVDALGFHFLDDLDDE